MGILRSYFRGVKGIVLVYDVNTPSSLESVKSEWLDIINSHVPIDVPVILVGNKLDLESKVSQDLIQAICERDDRTIRHSLASALKNEGVEEVFYSLANMIGGEDDTNDGGTVSLQPNVYVQMCSSC
eukprot:TRINITY_DN2532_c0_g1_i1.p1 TRINITY_DN2532_c0_g1~~TRINITY_DN2532_c0_g1_i1.p1  ORF type:complete len:127 (-),score=20.36 TRINITY_DN2532_c0_g1_i1:20-400(-)